MAEKYFYVHNGLTVGTLSIDGSTGNIQTSGISTVTNTTAASSTNTGALQVAGGAGIAGGLVVGGTVTATTFVGAFTGAVTGSLTSAVTFNNGNTGDASGTTYNGSAARTISANTLGALSLASGGTVSGAVTFTGPVTFSGTATYSLSTNTYYTDNILELHVPTGGVNSPWFVDDGKDIGFRFHYYTASTDTNAALVLANDSKWLEWYSAGAEGTSTFVGSSYGNFKTGGIWATANMGVGYTAAQVGEKLGVNGGVYVNGIVTATTFIGAVTGTASNASKVTNAHSAGTGLTGTAFDGSAAVTWTLNTATLMQVATQVVQSLSTGTGILGAAYNGSTAQTWTLDTSTLMAKAVTLVGGTTGQLVYQSAANTTGFVGPGSAGQILVSTGASAPAYTNTASIYVQDAVVSTNLRAGVAGSLPYQSGANATTFLGIGTNGYVLTSNGSAPVWSAASGITAGYAAQVQTVANPSSATFYPTFVSANNASATAASVYTTSSFYLNAATGFVGIGASNTSSRLTVAGRIESTTDPASEGGQVVLRGKTWYRWSIDNYQDQFRIIREDDVTESNGTTALSVSSNTNSTIMLGTTTPNGGERLAVNGGVYVNGIVTATTFVGALTGTASTATSAATAYATIGTLTAGTGLSGTAFNGSANQTWTLNTSTLMANAVTAINLAGGTAGQFAYQTGAGATSFVSTGSMYVYRATLADSASGSAGSVANALTIGTGLSGTVSTYNGSAAVTVSLNTATYMATAAVATSANKVANAHSAGTYLVGSAFDGSAAQTWSVDATSANTVSKVVARDANGDFSARTITLSGNLIVQGTTVTVDSTVTNIADPIITIGGAAGGAAPASNDSKDRGIAFQWHNGTVAKVGFLGYKNSSGKFTFIPDATITNEVASGTKGALDANIAGGTAMSLVYQSAADTTAFLAAGTSGYVLQTNGTGSAPSWVATSSLTAGSASQTAFSLTAGTGLSGTSFNGSAAVTWTLASTYGDSINPYGSKTANYVLAAPNGSAGVPSFRAIVAADIPTLNQNTTGSAGSVANSLTAGTGLTGTAFNGSAAVTWTLNTATLMQTTVNLGSGAAGSLPYQTAANATGFLAIGTNGYVLVSNGSAPTWVAASTLTAGTASATSGSLTAGTGLSGASFNGSTNVTWTNAGVTSNVAGTGISVSGATGAVTITNTGVTSVAGTTNQVNVSASTGAVTLSTPQNIHSGATPTFAGMTLNGALAINGNTTASGSMVIGGTTTTNKFEVRGLAGQLFSVSDTFTGTIFAASDVSGIPSIEVLDTGLVKLAQYNGTVAIGTGTAVSGSGLAVWTSTYILSLGVGTSGSGTIGEIRATNEVTAYYSDRRLKENVQIIDNALVKVLSLTGITYTANEVAESFGYDRTKKLVGVFADEIEAVLPEAVRPAPFDLDDAGNSKSGENYKTVQYEKIVPLLIEAIKEQQKSIETLQNELAQLKSQI